MIVRLPIVRIEMQRRGEVIQRLLIILQVQVAFAAIQPSSGLIARIVFNHFREVNYCIVPISKLKKEKSYNLPLLSWLSIGWEFTCFGNN